MAENWAESAANKVRWTRAREHRTQELDSRKRARLEELAVGFRQQFESVAQRAVAAFNCGLGSGEHLTLNKGEREIELHFGFSALTIEFGGTVGRKDCLTVTWEEIPSSETKRKEYPFVLESPERILLQVEDRKLEPADAVRYFLEPLFLGS
jgi:hypothetical protein